MSPRRVKSKKTGRTGWQYRVTDPASGRRVKRTIWIGERREADKGLQKFLEDRERLLLQLPDSSGWRMGFEELVNKFIAEAPITTDNRRQLLKGWLVRNLLGIQVAADLANVGKLTAGAQRLLSSHTDHFIIATVQAPLKQLSRWAVTVGILPHDPLAGWRRLPFSGHKRRSRALLPEEMRAILAAANEYDGLLGRRYPSSIIYKVLLLTGNRPSALFEASVGDLEEDRICLPYGNSRKRNGMATLPKGFMPELHRYLMLRGKPKPEESLLVSYDGQQIDRSNLRQDFKRVVTLAFVRMVWDESDPLSHESDPMAVAHIIATGKVRGKDGRKPTNPAKIAKRQRQVQAVEALAARLRPEVEARLKGVTLYCLRKTHISWARRLVNPDSVKLQVGHAPQDVEERHYLDLVDAHESSEAVWDVLNGVRSLKDRRAEARAILALAAGAENDPVPAPEKALEVVKGGPIVAPVAVCESENDIEGQETSSQRTGTAKVTWSGRQDLNRKMAPMKHPATNPRTALFIDKTGQKRSESKTLRITRRVAPVLHRNPLNTQCH